MGRLIVWSLVALSALPLGSASAQTYTVGQLAPILSRLTPAGRRAPGTATSSGSPRSPASRASAKSTIQANVPGLDINQRVIDLERTEPIARTSGGVVGALQPYMRDHVTSTLIRRGQSNYSNLYGGLRSIEARWGVDPTVLLAIYGHETSYGLVTGSTDLLQALASLGYYGRRRDFFEGEFISALKLMDQGVPRWRLKGSWAGATGFPQFMPSVALRLRADGDGDGFSDIWSDELDGLASIASYLRDAGWKPNVAWGIPVRTPANLNRAAIVIAHHRSALPAGLSPPQPLADDARMARARRDPARAIASG